MILTANEIIKKSLNEYKLGISKGRRDEIVKFLDYYSGTETEKYIQKYFDSDAFMEIPQYKSNITKKFVNKMSRLYTVGAKRNVNKVYDSMTHKKNFKMKHIEKMTKLLGTLAVGCFYEEHDDKKHFHYVPVYYFMPFFDKDMFNPYAITYPNFQPVDDAYNTEKLTYSYYDSEKYIKFDDSGKILEEVPNESGVFPFTFFHREDQIDSFFVEGANDIISANEHINITMTEMQLGLRYQMFGQPVASGVLADQNIARAGSNEILMLGDNGKFEIVSPQGNIGAVIENIKLQLELVALNNHLYITFSDTGGEVPSGIALKIKDVERMEDYQDDKELFRMFEYNLYKKEYELARFNGISLPNPENFKIDFYDVEYPMTIQDQILQDDFNLKHNLTTEAHILMRDNKDLSFDDAVATIAENKEINEMLMGDFAEEPTESEKNPEEPQKEEVKPEIPEGHHMHADGTIMKDEDMK
tara:strand:+ start:4202 stop:5614 length:1413 start_codon:yes stop_codon:yes gene_type:complete